MPCPATCGIDCGAKCAAAFGSGTAVALAAVPAAGWTFRGWTGACTGTGPGEVTSSPGGISCGGDCSETYTSGTSVTLSANPTGLLLPTFLGWTGACLGLGGCTVTMTGDQTVVALFSP